MGAFNVQAFRSSPPTIWCLETTSQYSCIPGHILVKFRVKELTNKFFGSVKKEKIMLQVQDVDLTPNPQALKFVINEKLLNRETRNFKTNEEAQHDPLAKGIFEIPGVVSVFYMDKFITIEKDAKVAWGQIQRPFVEFIKTNYPYLQQHKLSFNEFSAKLDCILESENK